MRRIGLQLRTAGICATLVVAGAYVASHPSQARDWMSPPVRVAAEAMLSSMPDDWFTVKDVAAEKEIATGVPLVVDVREPTEFTAEHIVRAKNSLLAVASG